MRDSYPQSLEKIFIELEGSNKNTLQLIQQRATILLKLNRAVMGLYLFLYKINAVSPIIATLF